MTIQEITQALEEHRISNLEALAILKTKEREVKAAIELIQPEAYLDAEKYGGTSFKAHGFAFELRGGGRQWDYKGIPEWADKNKELKEIEASAKAAYSAYEKNLITANADGEEVVLPKVTFSNPSLIVKK